MVLSEHSWGIWVVARRESCAFEKLVEVGSLDDPTYCDLARIRVPFDNVGLRDVCVRRDVRTVRAHVLSCWWVTVGVRAPKVEPRTGI